MLPCAGPEAVLEAADTEVSSACPHGTHTPSLQQHLRFHYFA
jgi:hypothetical protein